MSETYPELLCVSITGLLSGDSTQVDTLLQACETNGCFYLIMEDALLAMAQRTFSVADEVFKLSLEEKLRWEMDKWGDLQIAGYKATGKHTGVVEGKRDGFENFLMPLNMILGLKGYTRSWPPLLQKHRPLLTEYELACQSVGRFLLAVLSENMHPNPETPFEDLHRPTEPSTTSLAMLRYEPSSHLPADQVGHMAHTDVGSLTLLCTSSPGLQVFGQRSHSWVPVPPRDDAFIVNVGDTLSFMSQGRFRSCLHRVVPHVDDQGMQETRFSAAFFLRPELTARFVDPQGREWTGEEWHRTKYRVFRAGNDEQKGSALLTGRVGFLGSWHERTIGQV